MKLSVIVPCYNESDNVINLYNHLLPIVENLISNKKTEDKELSFFSSAEIIFVDDGSRDDTFIKLRKFFSHEDKIRLKCKFVQHETNYGLGAAIRTGFSNSEGDVILTVDSDGTYKFSEIPSLLNYLKTGVDIVTASPYHPQGTVVGVPSGRLFLSKGSSFLYRLLVDWNIHTYTSLFRAYRSDVVKNITFKSNGFLAGTEILVNAILRGKHVVEFPTALTKRMYGVSKAKIAQTIFAHLNFQIHLLFIRFRLADVANEKQINQGHV